MQAEAPRSEMKPFPKSRAEEPEKASPFGMGAEAAWGIYLRCGVPVPSSKFRRDLKDFLAGYEAAYDHIMDTHPDNLAVARQGMAQLRYHVKNLRDDNAKLRAELKGRKGGGGHVAEE